MNPARIANPSPLLPTLGIANTFPPNPSGPRMAGESRSSEKKYVTDLSVPKVMFVAAGKIAGAVGTYASISPEVEAHVMEKLGLECQSLFFHHVS